MSRAMRRWPRLRRVLNGVLVLTFLMAMSSSAFGPAIAAATEGGQDAPPAEESAEVAAPEEEVSEPPAEPPAEELPGEPVAETPPGEQVDEAPVEEVAEEPVAEPVEEPAEEPAEEPVTAPVEESMEAPAEPVAEEPAPLATPVVEGDAEADPACHPAPIKVCKYYDYDMDGTKDWWEKLMLPGFFFVLEREVENDWVQVGQGVTDDSGCVEFGRYPQGTYRIREILSGPQIADGWVLSTPMPVQFDHKWDRATCRTVGNYQEFEKRWVLRLENAPAGAEFFVRFDYSYDDQTYQETVPLDGGSGNSHVGAVDLPKGAVIQGAEWYAEFCGQHITLKPWTSMSERMCGDRVNRFRWDSKIWGMKFYDGNRNGEMDGDCEPPLEGWTIKLFRCCSEAQPDTVVDPETVGGDCDWQLVATTQTGSDGYYRFPDVLPGLYYVKEEVPEGWSAGPTGDGQGVFISLRDKCERVDFGNYHEDVTKSWILGYENAPRGTMARVVYSREYCGESTRHEVMLERQDASTFVGMDEEVPWRAVITAASWQIKPPGHDGWIVLEVQDDLDEVMGESRRNRYDYEGRIYGYKFEDLNGDGEWQQDCEPGIPNWTIRLEHYVDNGDAVVAPDFADPCTIAETTTGRGGYFEFKDVPPGCFIVMEEHPEGWTQTTGSEGPICIPEGGGVGRVLFGNQRDPVTKSWILEYENAPEGTEFKVVYAREWCGEGTSTRHEVMLEAHETLENTYVGQDQEVPYGVTITAASWQMKPPGHDWIVLAVEQDLDEEMTTSRRNRYDYDGKIYGYKYHDMNGNGVWDEGEPPLEDWTIQIDHYVVDGNDDVVPTNSEPCMIGETTTDAEGYFEFGDLPPGCYVVGEVIDEEEWMQTAGPPVSEPFSVCIEEGGGEQEVLFGNRKLLDKAFELTLLEDSPDDVSFYATYTITDGEAVEDTVTALPGDNPYTAAIVVPYGTEIGDVSWYADLNIDGKTETGIFLDTTPGEVMTVDATNTVSVDPRVFGKKTDVDTGGPVGGVQIILFRDVDPTDGYDWVKYRETVTDENGEYEFTDILPGTYSVLEDVPDGWTQMEGPTEDDPRPFDLENNGEEEVNFGNQKDEEPSLPFTPPTAAPGGEPATGAEPTTTTDQPYLPYTGGNLLLLLAGAGLAALGGTLLKRYSA